MGTKEMDIVFGDREGLQPEMDEDLKEARNRSEVRRIHNQQELEDAQHEADVAKARAAAEKAKKEAEGPRQEAPQSPFQFRGSMDFGDFNFMEMLNAEKKRNEELMVEMKRQIDDKGKAEVTLRDQLQESNNKLLEYKMMQIAAQMGGGQKDDLPTQVEKLKGIAASLGWNVGPATAVPTTESLSIQLQQMKQNFDLRMEEIKDAREDRNRQWELDKLKYTDEKAGREAAAQAELHKYQFFSSMLNQLGENIARAMVEAGNNGRIAERPQGDRVDRPQREVETPVSETTKQTYHFDATPGSSGPSECPECGTEVYIGPTATAVVCSECGNRYPINRIEVTQ